MEEWQKCGLTFTRGAGRGFSGPLPVRSMYFFKSVLRNSNTCWYSHRQNKVLSEHYFAQPLFNRAVVCHVVDMQKCLPDTELASCALRHAAHTRACASREQIDQMQGRKYLKVCFPGGQIVKPPYMNLDTAVNTQAGTHFTTWLLSLSICNNDTSRNAVEGTPSSSICE